MSNGEKTSSTDTPQQAMLRQITAELAKDIKTEADLNNILNQFVKMTVEAALGAEMEHHLGYAKRATEGRGTGNSRNGFSPKTLTSPYGELAIETPRDRNSEFEPVIVQKGQTRLTGFDDQILAFYAQGMTTREITDTFKKLYDADVSPTLISKVTDAVIARVTAWRSRPLDNLYPIFIWTVLSLRCIRISGLSINRCTSRWVSIWKDKRNV
nr:transposase [Serratia symbiotica]